MNQESIGLKDQKDLLLKWYLRFKKSEEAHYKSANSCRIFNYALGIPLVIITTITASEYFGFFEANCRKIFNKGVLPNFEDLGAISIMVVILTLIAPVIAALQTFLRFPERAEQHRKAAVNFGLLKKEIEKLLAFPFDKPNELSELVTEIQKKDEQVMQASPSIGAISLWSVNFSLKRKGNGFGQLKNIFSKEPT